MLAIVGGKLCCVVSLVPCYGGTTLYSTVNLTGPVGTVVLYSSNCYTVSSTTTCGTIITGPFTTESGCSASDCTSGGTTCLPASDYPTTVTVGGLNGVITNCGGTNPFQPDGCHVGCDPANPLLYTVWDGGMTYVNPGYAQDSVGGSTTVTLADGRCAQLNNATLNCGPSPVGTTYGWTLDITLDSPCGAGGDSETAVYMKVGTDLITGTYTFVSKTGSCAGGTSLGWPATLTVS